MAAVTPGGGDSGAQGRRALGEIIVSVGGLGELAPDGGNGAAGVGGADADVAAADGDVQRVPADGHGVRV